MGGRIDPNAGVNGGVNPITTICREYFTASKLNGLYDGPGAFTMGGQVFDCRKRGWYSRTKVCLSLLLA